ncbi:MAG: phosphoenolpyruvate--protein phosphotransferase [Gammaproteobacteria bacterium]|nr:phosphoenolpyruvate--protein phosphotransferase [Gammaproteobacteria bacterium]MDD9869153.1 phosphoenolpyruvate--protein phosphotransferase [Gammaproteobacteria bacterium]MDD9886166.1 phosphoenolpyruvate--protein phosphotransferase [Gammaproteobacteria bacterium]
MTLLLNGLGVSRGIAIGPVHILERGKPESIRCDIPGERVGDEVKRFRKAHRQAARHLRDIRKSIPGDAPPDIAAFIDSHLLMIDDVLLKKTPADIIRQQKCNAEWALQIQANELVRVFDEMQDSYLKTRRDDVEHIIRLIQGFLGDENYSLKQRNKDLKGCIIAADDLAPADTIVFEHQHIAGFITEYGGPTSHTAILSRSFGIPSIVAVANARAHLAEGERVIIDGTRGLLVIGADNKMLRDYRRQIKLDKEHRKKLEAIRKKPARTRDGARITLMANIELDEDIRALRRHGADGVGLYRTEFLYIDRHHAAGEDEQLAAYRKILRAAGGNIVTIRTLDLGAEKEFDPDYAGPLAPNPALGLRAIRRSLKNPDVFLRQLRAILRASAHGKLRILIPMLTSTREIGQIMELYRTAQRQLTKAKKRFNQTVAIGGMIEVPAAAMAAETLGRELDFLSIGTNDLIQYALAIDRIDEEVSYLYDPLHPGVLQLIDAVIRAGERLKIPVAMCGEMAGDRRFVKLLLAMGLREFSVQPNDLLEVKSVIMDSDLAALKRKYRRIAASREPGRVAEMVG